MAQDGVVIANITHGMKSLIGGRIAKIAMPEAEKLLLTINAPSGMQRLIISAASSLPLMYFVDENRVSPMVAPAFCMLLRKHIGNGRIKDVYQPDFERIIVIEIEHLNEMGDIKSYHLITELMGKYSNIIFTDDKDIIIDSIKRIPASISSLREVLPGRTYFIPDKLKKINPLTLTANEFDDLVSSKDDRAGHFLYTSFTGISPVVAEELCYRAKIDPDAGITTENKSRLFNVILGFAADIKEAKFSPQIIYKDGEVIEFSSVNLSIYDGLSKKHFDDIGELLRTFYSEKEKLASIKQKTSDLRRIVESVLSRETKKLELYEKQLTDAGKKDIFKKKGELIRTYAYDIKKGEDKVSLPDYEKDGAYIDITLDRDLSPNENANRYFEKYQKLSRTQTALLKLAKETEDKVLHLSEIRLALDSSLDEGDIEQIRLELAQAGYIKKHTNNKMQSIKKAKPLHFVTDEGFHIYVGKNNIQNEQVTFQIAQPEDYFMHIKGRAGSHVILKSDNREISDKAFLQAGMLAAYYSSAKEGEKVEVDYTLKKNVKKPAKGRCGLVIYNTNYSLVATAIMPSGVTTVS